MKTKTPTVNQQVLTAAVVQFELAKAERARLAEALIAAKAALVTAQEQVKRQRAAVAADRAAAAQARVEAKAERQAKSQARKDAAVAKAEARLAKARERALKPVGIKKAKADRKPGAVTVIVPATQAAETTTA